MTGPIEFGTSNPVTRSLLDSIGAKPESIINLHGGTIPFTNIEIPTGLAPGYNVGAMGSSSSSPSQAANWLLLYPGVALNSMRK